MPQEHLAQRSAAEAVPRKRLDWPCALCLGNTSLVKNKVRRMAAKASYYWPAGIVQWPAGIVWWPPGILQWPTGRWTLDIVIVQRPAGTLQQHAGIVGLLPMQ